MMDPLSIPMSVKCLDAAFMKGEKWRGERTLPWATVLNVILTLPMSVWDRRKVVCSYRDFFGDLTHRVEVAFEVYVNSQKSLFETLVFLGETI